MTPRTYPITVVLPDSGPLISLAMADALELLLVFKDQVRVVITDFVEFEVTRYRNERADAQKICDFILRHAGLIEIEKTSIGEALIQQFKIRQRYDEDAAFRQSMNDMGISPPPLPRDAGELSIVSFVNGLISNPPGEPVLVIAEDDFFLASGVATPGNAHIVSTRSFLEALSNLGKVRQARHVWADMKSARPGVSQAKVDRPAQKISTSWKDVVDDEKAEAANTTLRRKHRM